MRGLDRDQTAQAMMDSNRMYYNCIGRHQALKGKTTAEKAGIDMKLEGNKWMGLIRQAKRTSKVINDKKEVEDPERSASLKYPFQSLHY